MENLPQSLQDFIIDNIQFYGTNYWIFAQLSRSEIKQYTDQGVRPLQCVYLPVVDTAEEFSSCNNTAIPTIWQGIKGEYEIYHEKSSDAILDLLFDEFDDALSEPQTRKLYQPDSLKIIMERITDYKEKKRFTVKRGYLVQLDANVVPFAKKYPIARVITVLNNSPDGLDIKLVHQQSSQGKIINVRKSDGWIHKRGIKKILSTSTDRKIHFSIYTQQQFKRTKEIYQLMKKNKKSRFKSMMTDYFGKKIKNELKDLSFKRNKKRGKQCSVEQDVNREDVNDCLIPILNKQRIEYTKNDNFLKIQIKTPSQMGVIIGTQNILNESNGYQFFMKYPIEVIFGYKWVFPRLKAQFDVLKSNRAGNLER